MASDRRCRVGVGVPGGLSQEESVTGRQWSLLAGQGEVEGKGPLRADVKCDSCHISLGPWYLKEETNSKTTS